MISNIDFIDNLRYSIDAFERHSAARPTKISCNRQTLAMIHCCLPDDMEYCELFFHGGFLPEMKYRVFGIDISIDDTIPDYMVNFSFEGTVLTPEYHNGQLYFHHDKKEISLDFDLSDARSEMGMKPLPMDKLNELFYESEVCS